jgi:hypothetical protein
MVVRKLLTLKVSGFNRGGEGTIVIMQMRCCTRNDNFIRQLSETCPDLVKTRILIIEGDF